jgi:uncharacterized protein YndB with AHSA1/START domain
MKTDFQPVAGHDFQLRGDWGTVDCRVLEIEPHSRLSYSWTAFDLKTVVTCTLTPSDAGTHLRVEQAGFSAAPEHRRFVQGAEQGWTGFLAKLDEVLAGEP